MQYINRNKRNIEFRKAPRKLKVMIYQIYRELYCCRDVCNERWDNKKNLSRRFKIKTVLNQDDPRCMKEVISRRLKHSIENPKGGFGELPDLIFVDGGITQIKAAEQAVLEYNLKIPVYGMVKMISTKQEL